jgi:chitodextrinase
MTSLVDAPPELQVSIQAFWPEEEWDNAAAIAKLESDFDAFALDDTTDADHECGAVIRQVNGVDVSAERSVGYFQINTCNYPGWDWKRLWNAYQNAGTAHMIWAEQGWGAWYFSAHQLGLV